MPSSGPENWKQFLAKPELHWATGYSARTLAHCWEASAGLPPEIEALLVPAFGKVELLLALPEHKTPLPGGRRESQSDVFALVRSNGGLIACAVEGKVEETFGPTIAEWSAETSDGKRTRLEYLCRTLGIAEPPPTLRYQLLHRTVSAIIEAERFHASAAAMIIHSFSHGRRWFDDFRAFAKALGADVETDRLKRANVPSARPLYIGWACGDEAFLNA